MRRYSSVSQSTRQGWQKHQVKKSWQSLFSVFITITLVFAIINGLFKSISWKSKIASSNWDSRSALVLAINTTNPSVFIYQPDSRQMSILSIAPDTNYETGDRKNPIEVISEQIDADVSFTKVMSHVFGAKIDNYIMLKNENMMDESYSKKFFADFASIVTPFELLTAGWGKDIKNTNITRIDAFKLWWQLKALSVESLAIADLSGYREEILTADNQRVLGVDVVFLNREISKYLQNFGIVNDDSKIRIKNSSGRADAGKLAYSFVSSLGGKVVEIENSDGFYDKTFILAKNKSSYTASYLAKVFNCDIKDTLEGDASDGQIILVLGQDFAKEYFE